MRLCASPAATRGQGAHRAGADDHRIRRIGAGGERREPFLAAEHVELSGLRRSAARRPCTRRARRQDEIHFLPGDDLRGLRIQQLHARAGGEQAFEQAQAVGHAGGAGQGDGDGLGLVIVLAVRFGDDSCGIIGQQSGRRKPVCRPKTSAARRTPATAGTRRRAAPATGARAATGRRCGRRRPGWTSSPGRTSGAADARASASTARLASAPLRRERSRARGSSRAAGCRRARAAATPRPRRASRGASARPA